jgi:DNA/RNA-binding domain of Phe-tRNA-synthetase-like protein
MKIRIANSIAETYPDLRIGVILGSGIDNTGTDSALNELKRNRAAKFRESYTTENLMANPYIEAWRETYRSFGAKPKKYKPTAEALLRRIIKGSEIPQISKAVDSYLVIETEYFLPIGGYDIDKVDSFVCLRHSTGDEKFIPLGSQGKIEMTDPGEVIYADKASVLTRRWNYRDCDYCKITEDTTNLALFTEAPYASISTDYLIESLCKLESYILKFCGGSVTTFVANVRDSLDFHLI